MGATVDLEVKFSGKSVVVPIYLRAARHAGSEFCLLGTNVVGPLGLMCLAAGVEPNGGDGRSNSIAIVQLVHAQRVPSHKGTFLEAQVEASPSSLLLFEPNRGWTTSMGVEFEDSVSHSDAKG